MTNEKLAERTVVHVRAGYVQPESLRLQTAAVAESHISVEPHTPLVFAGRHLRRSLLTYRPLERSANLHVKNSGDHQKHAGGKQRRRRDVSSPTHHPGLDIAQWC